MKINISIDDANAVTVDCLKKYYMDVLEQAGDSSDWDCLVSLDVVLSHFMTTHEYEDFANGLREDAPRV